MYNTTGDYAETLPPALRGVKGSGRSASEGVELASTASVALDGLFSEPAPVAFSPSPGLFTLSDVKPASGVQAAPSSNTGLPHTRQLVDWLGLTFHGVALADVLKLFKPRFAVKLPDTASADDAELAALGAELDQDFAASGIQEPTPKMLVPASARHGRPVSAESLLEVAASGGWVAIDKGANGYRACFQRGSIRVLHDGQENMGVHVSLSGQGCRQLEQEQGLKSEQDWQQFLGVLRLLGVVCTRFDWAMDDTEQTKLLDMATIHRMAVASTETGEVVSQFRETDINAKRRLGRPRKNEPVNPEKGDTRYFGNKAKSLMFVRIYNKSLEQLLPEGTHWIRVEMCARGKNADAALAIFLADGASAMPEILLRYLDFKQPSETDSNPSRWPTVSWWADFLGTVAKRGLDCPGSPRTVEKTYAWIVKQAAPSLAVVFEAAFGEVDELLNIIKEGRRRFTAVHRSMLEAWSASLTARKEIAASYAEVGAVSSRAGFRERLAAEGVRDAAEFEGSDLHRDVCDSIRRWGCSQGVPT